MVDWHSFGFCVTVENDLLFLSGSKVTGVVWGFEVVLYAGSKLTGLSVGTEHDLFFVYGSKTTSVLCTARELLGFSVWINVDLVLGCRSKITFF